MVTIGNVDQIMALVRNQLERMARDGRRVGTADKSKKSEAARATGKATAASSETRLQALTNLADLPEEEFERVLVGALLSHEFGEEIAQDPRFQAVVDRTSRILREDPELASAAREVRSRLSDVRR